jgi:hypothetical protein
LKESSLIYYRGKNHKDIFYRGKYHKAMYLGNNLVWEKLEEDNGEVGGNEFIFTSNEDWSEDENFGKVSFSVKGNIKIDWGDGYTTNVNNYNEYEYVYHWYNYPDEITEYEDEEGNWIDIESKYYSFPATIKITGDLKSFESPEYLYEIVTPLPKSMADMEYTDTIYDDNYNVIHEGDLILYCQSLSHIPKEMFKNCPNIKSYKSVFAGHQLEEIPNDIFAYAQNATDFSYALSGSGGTAFLPDNLFENCRNGEYFAYVLSGVSLSGEWNDETNDYVYKEINSLFANCKKAKDLNYALRGFKGYSVNGGYKLLGNVFQGCDWVEDFSGAFTDCNFSSIEGDTFKNCLSATDFSNLFGYGTNNNTTLTSIKGNMFSGCINVESFSGVFKNCTALYSVEGELFKDCINAGDFSHCFENCYKLSEAPVFKDLPKAMDFSYCFYNSSAKPIENMINNCPLADNFEYIFAQEKEVGKSGNYSGITNITANVFADCVGAVKFNNAFENSAIKTISDSIFTGCTNAEDFTECFLNCTNLTTVCNDLFLDCANAVSFKNCFMNDSAMTTAPAFTGLSKAKDFSSCFAYTKVNVVNNMFAGCSSAETFEKCFITTKKYASGVYTPDNTNLTSIATNIFAGCSSAVNFSNCFLNCAKLTDVTTDLFSDCTSAEDFTSMFEYTAITRVPIFSNCSNAKTFNRTFANTNVEFITEDNFSGCNNVEDFSYTFYKCNKLTSMAMECVKDWVNLQTVDCCFYEDTYCYPYTYWWEIIPDVPNHNECFTNTGINNMTDEAYLEFIKVVPSAWGRV